MSSASCRALTDLGSMLALTVVPRRITVISSATDRTSSSLWEMKMTVRPSDFSSRRLSKSSLTSCGTRTAVGSSRMRILAPRKRTLRISTRCRLPDAEVGDEGVGVDAQPVGVGDVDDRLAGVVADPVQLLRAEHDVLEDGEVVGEHEVLEDHADARVDRVGGAAQGQRLAVDGDGALVGLLHAVEDLHQRRLAGAVLPDDRVDGAAPDGDLDVLVGDDAREALGDAVQLDRRSGASTRRVRPVSHSRVGDDVLLGTCSPRMRLARVGANL